MAGMLSAGVFFALQFALCASTCTSQEPSENCSHLDQLRVTFSGTNVIECGTTYANTFFDSSPKVKFDNAIEGKTYTLTMVDPDAPNHGHGTYWLHWILANVKASDLKSGNPQGTLINAYSKPTPPSGTHRYFIYLYEECNQNTFSQVDKKSQFNLKQYAEQNGLNGPIAMNMFKVPHE